MGAIKQYIGLWVGKGQKFFLYAFSGLFWTFWGHRPEVIDEDHRAPEGSRFRVQGAHIKSPEQAQKVT